MPDSREFQTRMQRLDEMLQEATAQADPASQARLQEVSASLLEMHRAGLERIVELLNKAGDSGEAILNSCSRDELVSGLLVLHGLHPLDLEARVRRALEKVAPYAASHGGNVDLVSVSEDGVVRLRLEGSCHGCPSSRVTLQSSIEQEIYAAAPEIVSIECEGLVEAAPPQPSGFVPLDQLAVNGIAIHAAAS
ncbi:NifU family protein [soil metagenome]